MFKTIVNLDNVIEQSKREPILIYKDSMTCPVSSRARFEMEKFIGTSKIPVFLIIVQKERGLSNEVEEKLGIKHETPQLMYIKDGKPVFCLNHHNINPGSILEKLKEAGVDV